MSTFSKWLRENSMKSSLPVFNQNTAQEDRENEESFEEWSNRKRAERSMDSWLRNEQASFGDGMIEEVDNHYSTYQSADDEWYDSFKKRTSNLQSIANSYRSKYANDKEALAKLDALSGTLGNLRNYAKNRKDYYAQFGSKYEYDQALKKAEEDAARWKELTGGYDASKHQQEGRAGWEKYQVDLEKKDSGKKWYEKAAEIMSSDPVSNYHNANLDLSQTNRYFDSLHEKRIAPDERWNDEQRDTYGYLYNQDPAKAEEYAFALNNQLNIEYEDAQKEKIRQKATTGFWKGLGHTAASLPASMAGIIDYYEDIYTNQKYGYIPEADGRITPFEYSQAIQGGISDKLNEKGTVDIPFLGERGLGDLYGLGTSAAQSMVGGKLLGSVGTLISFFGSSAASGVDDAKRRGASDEQALMYGAISGAAEVITEKIPLDHLMNMGSAANWKSLFADVLKQGGEEFLGEGMNSVITSVADYFTFGDKSEYESLKRQYMANNGLSEADAGKEAFKSIAKDIAFDAVGGFITGTTSAGIFGGAATAVDRVDQAKQAKAEFGGVQNELVDESLKIDSDNRYAQKMRGRLDSGKNLSGMQMAKLVRQNDQATYDRAYDSEYNTALKKLADLGETGDIHAIADAIARAQMGEQLSSHDRKQIRNSEHGEQVYYEIHDAQEQEKREFAKWYQKIVEDAQIARENEIVGKSSTIVPETSERAADNPNEVANNADADAQTDGIDVDLAEGKTILRDTHEVVEIDTISAVNDGKMTVRLKDGREVSSDSISYGSQPVHAVYTSVQQMATSPEKANTMINGFESNMKADDYIRGMRLAYTYGRDGIVLESLERSSNTVRKLPEDVKKAAYESGQIAGGLKFEKEQAVIDTKKSGAKKTGTTGKVHFTGDRSVLNERQQVSLGALDRIASTLGVQIHIFDSKVDTRHKNTNGWYDPKDSSIHLDLHAGNHGESVILFTAAHELTHFVRQWSPAKYKTLSNFLMSEYGEAGVNVDALIKAQMDKDQSLSREDAFEEMVADSMEKMLVDGNAIEKLEKLKAQDRTLWEKVRDFISDLVTKIRKVYKGMDAETQEGRYVSSMLDQVEKLQDLFVEAVADASDSLMQIGLEIDTDTDSVSPAVVKNSERTWTESDYVQQREEAAKEIAKAIGVSQAKAEAYIDSINSIAKMIAEDRVRLDYFSSPDRSSFVGNVEYGGSFDFSTLCKKRRLLTGTFTAIQKALPNTALTANEILDIRNRMKEADLEVSCGLCYVEGSRANMGQFAKEFLKLYKQYYPDAWQPNMADVNTPEGIEWVRINHPDCYEQYEYFWNHYGTLKPGDKNLFASQQKPKLYQLHTEYKGEILQKFNDENVEDKNTNGGIRLQSFSDFEIVHLIDTMQIIIDMSRVGLAGQAYTKVPDFAWALGDTGLKINLSLIAKGVDENGQLIFDDVEGMPIAEAMKLRDRYSKNVGTILVAFNDEQLIAAMADDRVDFIIPFHRSQWKKSQYGAMGLPAKTKDYTYMQNEKFIKPQFHEYRGRMVKDKATNYMPNEYWDFSKSGKENAEAYLEMCARNNKRPKFYKLLQNNGDGSYSLKADGSTDGYWKLLIDFKMYDNEGAGSPQEPVRPDFNMEEAERMLNSYTGGHSTFPVAQGIVDEFVEEYKEKHKGIKFSVREIVGESGTDYGRGVYLDSTDLAGLSDQERIDKVKDHLKNIGGQVFTAHDKNRTVDIYIAKSSEKFYNKSGKRVYVNKDLKSFLDKEIKQESIILVDELIETSAFENKVPARYPHGWVDNYGKNDWEVWSTYLQDQKNTIWEAKLQIANSLNGDKILYDIVPIKMVERSGTSDTTPTKNNITQQGTTVKNSLRDSEGSELTSDQQEYFKDSVVRDENGNLKRMYHGTANYGHRVFDPYGRSNYGLFGQGVYFTDDPDVAESYTGKGKTKAGKHPGVYEVYLNITNPMDMDATADPSEWREQFPDATFPNSGKNEAFYRAMEEYFEDEMYPRWEAGEIAMESIRGMGYDGITHVGGGRYNKTDTNRHQVYIAFDPEQIKNFDNENPTENSDIRYSKRGPSLSNRSLLANALEGVTQNSVERNRLREYKETISQIEAEEQKLAEIRSQIKALSKDRDAKQIEDLKMEGKRTANRINTYDSRLLRFEAMQPIQNVLEREKVKAFKQAEKAGEDAIKAFKREQKMLDDQRYKQMAQDYTQKRKEAVAQTREVAEKREMRRRIRRTIMDLDKILKRGNKTRNVKLGLEDVVEKTLASADILFMDNYTNSDLIRNGIGVDMTPEEARWVNEATDIIRKMDSPDSLSEDETIDKLGNQLQYRMSKIKDVFVRERIRLNKTTINDILTSLADAYSQIQGSEYDYIQGAFREEIYNHINTLKTEIGGRVVKDMTQAQLKMVYDAYTMVLTTVRDANKMFDAKLRESRDTLANRVIGEVQRVGEAHGLWSDSGDVINKFSWNNLKPVYAFERIGSGTLSQLYDNVRKGQDIWIRDVAEAKAFRQMVSKKYNLASWDKEKRYTFKTDYDDTFSLSLGEMMSIYAYSKRNASHDHLMKGGFVFDSKTKVIVDKNGIKRSYQNQDATAYQLTKRLFDEITKSLTKEQIQFVDTMQRYLSNTMGAKGNEVSMHLYGIELFGDENYFPIRSAGQYMEKAKEADLKREQGQVSIVNSGFTKSTVPKANNPIVLSDFMTVWAEHCDDMSMYHAFVLPMEDFRKVYNYHSPNIVGQGPISVNSILEKAYGKAVTQYIDTLYRDLNGGAVSDPRENIGKRLLGRFKKAAVFCSMSVVIQQPSAIGRALSEVDLKYFVGRKVDAKTHGKTWAELKKYAPVAMIKEMGYFDTSMGRSAVDYINSDEYTSIKEKAKGLVTDSEYRDEILSKGPALADELTWCAIWEAIKRETADRNPSLNARSEEFLTIAGNRFSEVIDKTQVYDSVLARSANMRSKNVFMNMATQFGAEPTTACNMMESALLQAKRGDKKGAVRKASSVYASILLNSVLASFWIAARDDDEEKTFWEKYFGSVVTEMMDGINPITYYPFLRDIWSIAQGYDIERSDMALFSDVFGSCTELVQNITDDDPKIKKIFESGWNVVDGISSFFGLPVKNVRRDINAAKNLYKTIDADIHDRDTSFGSMTDHLWDSVKDAIPVWGWMRDETKSDKLYETIINGDDTYYDRLVASYDDEASVTYAIRKALRDNDSRIWEAAVAWNDNELSTYSSIAKSIVAEGNFSQDDVVMAIRNEASSMQEPDGATEAKKKGYFTAEKFAVAASQNNSKMAKMAKEDIIATNKLNGKSEKDAISSFKSSAKSELKELYLAGGITKERLKKALVTYCDMEEGDADLQIQAYDWKQDGYEISAEAIDDYNKYCSSAGVSKEVFIDVRKFKGVEGTKKENVEDYIHKLNLTPKQKDAMYLACGYAESTLKNTPWH